MIEVTGLCVAIGRIEVLHGVNLSIESGQLAAVIGANGAGKTTLLRTISGVLKPTAGEIRLEGVPISGRPPHLLARKGLVHIPQGRQIVPGLTVEDNLLIGASQLADPGPRGERLAREYERFPILHRRRDVLAGALSGGEQQMLAISRGLMMAPKILMLDEPSLGLAPQIVDLIMRALATLRDQGLPILLVEQAARSALAVADTALVLRNGRPALTGPAARLRHDRELIASYLA
jgi:branched-chain amino acid transport system ATP-binding protein